MDELEKGVGTGRFDRLLGGAFGWRIKDKILNVYRFLMTSYEPEDELFFFGFSRGAYIARSTFGLIRNSGLLRPEFAHKLEDAYDLYRRRDNASHPDAVESELFRRSYSTELRAKFIGVWDTVGALGLPVGGLLQFINKRWSFHDVTLSSWVDNAYQALAIDEHRTSGLATEPERKRPGPRTSMVCRSALERGRQLPGHRALRHFSAVDGGKRRALRPGDRPEDFSDSQQIAAEGVRQAL